MHSIDESEWAARSYARCQNHVIQHHIHVRIALHQFAVVRLSIRQLHQLVVSEKA